MMLVRTVCEVHGYHKQGAAYGYTHTLGYHPLVASRADTGEVLHARQRTGRANTARGAARFVDDLAARVRRAGATISEDAWVDTVYPDGGVAQVAETRYQGDRLIVRRTRLVGEQAELFPNWRYHAFVTDRVGTAVWLDQDHRRHAVVELCIRDLKAGWACGTAPQAGSTPTPPGWWRPPRRTTCCAGPPGSGWAPAVS
jgi:hypothetical protein